jgi:hypothetical protein
VSEQSTPDRRGQERTTLPEIEWTHGELAFDPSLACKACGGRGCTACDEDVAAWDCTTADGLESEVPA